MNELNKKQMRAHYRAARADMQPEQREAQEREICANILQSPLYESASSVLLYAATEGEIDLSCVAADAWEKGKVVAYPRCLDKAGSMAFYVVDSPEQLEKGSFGILEPCRDCPLWQSVGDALCIVPALAVDKEGNRLGYGKGYYDRFLASFVGVRACAVFEVGMAEYLPHDAYDVPVQYVFDRKGEWRVDQKQSQDWQDDPKETIIDDSDFASEQAVPTIDDDYGEQEDLWEPEQDAEDEVDGTENIRWQRFMYKWKQIPLLGKLPFDPVMLPVLAIFVLLLLSRLIDALLIDHDNEYLVVVLLQILIFVIPGYLFFRFRGKEYARRMRLKAPRPDHIFLIASAAGALITGCFLLSVLMGNLSEGQSFVLYDTFTSRHDGTMAGMLYLVLGYAILPAVCEELIFRSMLCAEFEGRGVACAIAVSSVLFSMLHFNLLAMPVYLFAGVVLALTMYATRSVFCTMIVHFLYNLFCLFGQSAFADFYVTQSATTLFLILMIAALLLCLAVFCGECSRLYRAYAKDDVSDAYKPEEKLSGSAIAGNIGLAFASPAAILCMILYLIVCIFR
ncbi:MAG: 5-formyltetrahydrofolate cyclo-ligase [Clostridia bacterium]|nr:5-formyltetrahydrofolate cyclo-ligase [Clostridia bacterium]